MAHDEDHDTKGFEEPDGVGEIAALEKERDALKARLSALEAVAEAVRPFGGVAATAVDGLPDECPAGSELELYPITVGECRKLRDALAALPDAKP